MQGDEAREPEPEWYCEDYGPEGVAVGALCFQAEPGTRVCVSALECAMVMAAQRKKVFRRIKEKAAHGDPTAIYLAERFRTPEQLLGGRDVPPDAESDTGAGE